MEQNGSIAGGLLGLLYRSYIIPLTLVTFYPQACTEVLFLSLLSEFRSTVTPVVTEMIKLVQGK